MLERDYIMRLIRQFFEALEKFKEEKAEKQSSTLQLEIHSMYRAYFHQPESFFLRTRCRIHPSLSPNGISQAGIPSTDRDALRTAML